MMSFIQGEGGRIPAPISQNEPPKSPPRLGLI